MKLNRILLATLLALAITTLGCNTMAAQDSRGRTATTIVSDGLAQLPAKDAATFNQVMGEMAGTGAQGVEQIAGMLKPAGLGKNATFEYALNGIVDYVTQAGKESLAAGVRQGLIKSLGQEIDANNKAFLLTLLATCGTADDASVFAQYLDDADLGTVTASCLSKLPGCDDAVLGLMKPSKPIALLAQVAYNRKLKAAEPILLAWLGKATDTTTIAAIHTALAACGSEKSLNALEKAAKKAGFADDPTAATDSYLQLLDNIADGKKAVKAAKNLLKTGNDYVQCAATLLLIKNDNDNAAKNVVNALNNTSRAVRVAALDYGAKYAGSDIYPAVAAKCTQMGDEAITDVLRWLGNNHCDSQANLVASYIGSSNNEVATAAIEAAGKIGGNTELQALLKEASKGSHAKEARNALPAFNGSINEELLNALDGDEALQKLALDLVAQRHVHEAYGKVCGLLTAQNTEISNAAYNALAGVASSENMQQLAQLLENASSQHAQAVQNAMKNAIAPMSQQQQYEHVKALFSKTSKPQLYYPLLAQAGNAEAIKALNAAYNAPATRQAAAEAILQINNVNALAPLLEIAAGDASMREAALTRYLELVKQSNATDALQYLYYRRALEMKPSAAVEKAMLQALGQVHDFQALMLASTYLTGDNALTAAQAVQSIAKQRDYVKGVAAKQVLQRAKQVFDAQTDADSHYASTELQGIIDQLGNNGYKLVLGNKSAQGKFKMPLPGQYENFELRFDWISPSVTQLELRSAKELSLNSKQGVQLITGKKKSNETLNSTSNWNTAYVKMVNDRLMVVSNGTVIAENVPINTAISYKGAIQFTGNGNCEVRDVYINELPATPVTQLSEEERQQGFEMLFDGRDLNKWHGNKTSYVPEDGAIDVTARYGGEGNLYTNKKYSDFVLRFEFCFTQEGANNGIGIRAEEGKDAAYYGMEIQVLDHDAPIYKDLHPYQQHGSVYGVVVPKHVQFEQNKWNVEEIIAQGDHIKVTVNGVVVNDCDIRQACQGHNVTPDGGNNNPYTIDHRNHPGLFNKDGYICFCGHGPGVKFRNVRILDLSKASTSAKRR